VKMEKKKKRLKLVLKWKRAKNDMQTKVESDAQASIVDGASCTGKLTRREHKITKKDDNNGRGNTSANPAQRPRQTN
jgi:hypothetical protein